MSIFSAIGSGISKSYNAVKNVFTGNNTASAGMAFPVGAGLNPAQTQDANNAILKAGGNAPVFQTPIPSNFSTGVPSGQYQTPIPANFISSSTLSSGPTNGPTTANATFNISPTMGATTLSGATSTPSTPTEGGSTPTTPTSSFPSAPGYTNPGSVNNSGLAGALKETHTLGADGIFTPVKEDAAALAAKQRQSNFDTAYENTPKKESVLSSPEVQNAQNEVNNRKQVLQNYTDQLNSVVAKQNEDLLKVRASMSKEGSTEAVYGGAEAEINREAAIKALPIQAQIAAAQGNVQLAQDYLGQVTKIISENVDANYSYNKARFDFATQHASDEDKIKLAELNKMNDRAYAEKKDNLNFAQSLALKYGDQPNVINAVSNLLKNPDSPTLGADLLRVAGTVQDTTKVVKPEMSGQTLNLGSDPKEAQKRVTELGKVGITDKDIISLQKYLGQGYSLEQIAKMTGMPATVQSAFAQYIDVPKLGTGLPKNQ